MEKKQIHFFGCSYTAGHELADSYMFPWLNECRTREDYYKKFSEFKFTEFNLDEYHIECKKLAYPAILSSIDNRYNCINHAEFGASLKGEIYKAINIIEKNETTIDLLAFQIPYFTRELILTNDGKLENYLLGEIVSKQDNYLSRYAESKLVSHSPRHWNFHAHLELLIFEGYLESKKIPNIFLHLSPYNEFNLSKKIERKVKIWKLMDNIEYQILIGGHYNYNTHVNIANQIKNSVDAKLFP